MLYSNFIATSSLIHTSITAGQLSHVIFQFYCNIIPNISQHKIHFHYGWPVVLLRDIGYGQLSYSAILGMASCPFFKYWVWPVVLPRDFGYGQLSVFQILGMASCPTPRYWVWPVVRMVSFLGMASCPHGQLSYTPPHHLEIGSKSTLGRAWSVSK